MAQLKVTEAAVKQGGAALEAAELDLKYTEIRSPVDGVVISRLVEVGQRISASFSIPTLFLIAEDVMKMQVDTNVSEADIGEVTEGKDASFMVDAYPGEMFHGKVRQVRNAPINIQNVVTYDVVVEFDNPNFRLKPGMTANVSIIVAHREGVLTAPNAALRFTPPVAGRDSGSPTGRIAAMPEGSSEKIAQQRDARSRQVWTVNENDDPESMAVQVGISDGVRTEITSSTLKPNDPLIVGIESLRGERRSNDLPPGFGTGQPRSPRRDRGF